MLLIESSNMPADSARPTAADAARLSGVFVSFAVSAFSRCGRTGSTRSRPGGASTSLGVA
eukprot:41903-Heterocapsa_arctica.AAC.1